MIGDFYRRISEIYNLADNNRIEALEEAYLLFYSIESQSSSIDYDEMTDIIDALIEDIKGMMRDKYWRTGKDFS